MGEYIDAGKIRYIGLSECSGTTLRRAISVPKYGGKVIAVQEEFGPFTLDLEKGDLMEAIKETGVAVVAYSPLNRGLVTGRYFKFTMIFYSLLIALRSDSVLEPILKKATFVSRSLALAKRTSQRISLLSTSSNQLLRRLDTLLLRSAWLGFSLNILTVRAAFYLL